MSVPELLKRGQDDNSPWRIEFSKTRGRGLFANRDIDQGEIILVDWPLVLGPRTGSERVFCIKCFNLKNLAACPNNCGLPVCSKECAYSSVHAKECEFISRRSKHFSDKINFELFRCLTPLRGLLLNCDQVKVLTFLKSHKGLHHGFEVNIIKRDLQISEQEELLLNLICSVLDTNTFEVIAGENNDNVSLRAIYPLSSMLNHRCTPNVTHYFDSHQKMTFKASVAIKEGEEICHSYTKTFWGTCVRQPYLQMTKHFSCDCFRCQDPTECGTNLCAICCFNCKGTVLPLYKPNANVTWKCVDCDSVMSKNLVGVVLAVLGSRLNSLLTANPIEILNFLKNHLPKYAPMSNHVAIQLKFRLLWLLGYKENYLWNDLCDELLKAKEDICRELLKLLEMLGAGRSKMRGLILYELYCCLQEWKRRNNVVGPIDNANEIFEEAKEILKDDVHAPQEIKDA